MKKQKILIPMVLIVLAVFSLGAFVYLLNQFFPYQAVNLKINRMQAREKAENFLLEKGYDLSDYQVTTEMRYDEEAFIFLQKQFGFKAAQLMLKYKGKHGYDHFFRVLWFKNLPRGAIQEQFNVFVAGTGEIVGFVHYYHDRMDWSRPERAHLEQAEALEMALQFLKIQNVDLNEYQKDVFSTEAGEKRTDHIFRWHKSSPYNDSFTELIIQVQGDEIGQYQFVFHIPQQAETVIKRQSGNLFFVDVGGSFFILFFVGLFSLGFFLKKYHEGEVEVRRGVRIFWLIWGTFAVLALLKFRANAWNTGLGELSYDGVALFLLIVFLLILRPLMALFGFTTWSVGEALVRQNYGRKLTAIDGIMHGRFFTQHAAVSIFRGVCFGLMTLGLLSGLFWLAIHKLGCQTTIEGYHGIIDVPFSFLIPFLVALAGSILGELMFRLFSNMALYQFIKSKIVAVLLSSVLWAFYVPMFWSPNVSLLPYYYEISVWFTIGLFFGFIFWKYDLLTVFVANFITMGVMQTLPMITSGAWSDQLQGIVSCFLVGSPLIVMIIGFLKRDKFSFRPDIMPAHIRRITERVRMSRELEIARQVQMRLLPKTSPEVAGFEIRGFCNPAQETGGDYYDFIDLGNSRIGIVIGDVSGKGVPAAIYMTLTKGIVQSHADDFLSPAEVMVKVNNLLYKTIDKDSFVSLFYAVLDSKSRKVVYSRAGHNPVLHYNLKDQKCTLLEPNGIALGLEKGEIFKKVITQREVTLSKGDLLVFYTDGFTEAMNQGGDEYGEDRLKNLICKYHDKSSDQIYQILNRDIKHFIKDAPQHDDMTMVFVKGM